MSDPILRLEGVQTDIAQYHILQGVDLDVPRGKVTMLLGRNGVGKTTTLRTIMGHWRAKAGRITFDGADITARPTPAIARSGIGFVPENMGIFGDLTVEENMVLAAVSGRIDPARRDWIFEAFPPLRTFWKGPAGTLSGGQKQMLSIARAMIEERKLYLIDEPTKGLAPAIVTTMARALRELKEAGASILLVEQNFAVARALGDLVAVMDDGRVIWTGEMAELAGDAGLQERLMGLSMEGGH
ncbi:ABC transporter ATP-binding protein [Pseudooceanicola nanhaiensis]|uniref:ABC transporter ATP-binding protein n=1 Tax=Pseudooceanicola nanhaiensis TaxID=375761 RepID=UPI001CD49617|nr:ABC transporter ATP-binding protein [Pseudooceanicola nanhaiensis]MCA0921215.1 ABC transporter ATP-binding protein [Pseudooceanicola nanhaiensis]